MVLFLIACSGGSSPSDAPELPPALPAGGSRPDIVLVSVDTLRADHLGAYGYTDRPTSPFLDELAAKGTRFAHARSPSPWTLPTHTTMFTGLLPTSHLVVDDDQKVALDTAWLPQELRNQGYATCGAVATMYVSRKFGFERGFDDFYDFEIDTERKNLRGQVDAEDVIDRGLDCVEQRGADQPTFLFLHFYDVHYPYEAPGDWEELFDRPGNDDDLKYKNYFKYFKDPPSADQLAHQVAQYDEEIAYVDAQLRRLYDSYRDREVLFVVTSDHGEEFMERGSWGHAHTLYPEQLHVPLIVAGPGVKTQVVDEAVGTHDIAPTLAALAGEPMAGDGISLLGSLLSGEALPSRAFLSDTSRFKTNRVGLWEDGLRLDWNLKERKVELYADAAEVTDVAEQRADDVARLQGRVTDLLGAPWHADQGVLKSEGVILSEGAIVRRPVRVGEEGLDFVVVPADAKVEHGTAGPWRAAGGPHPVDGDAVAYSGQKGGEAVTMSEEEREALRALGYVQE